jgi:hypothetical protein
MAFHVEVKVVLSGCEIESEFQVADTFLAWL